MSCIGIYSVCLEGFGGRIRKNRERKVVGEPCMEEKCKQEMEDREGVGEGQ